MTTYAFARLRSLPLRTFDGLATGGRITEGRDPSITSIDLVDATATVTTGDELTILIEAGGRDALERTQSELSNHLCRSASPQEPQIVWSAPIRPATSDDDAALLQLDRVAWSDLSGFPSQRITDATSFFSPGGRTPDGLLIAEHGGRVAGMVKLRNKSPFRESAHVFSLVNLVVSPEVRRQGIASALLKVAEHVALGRGARKLSLSVLDSNTPAIDLYRRHGYVVEGRHSGEVLINETYLDDRTLGKALRF